MIKDKLITFSLTRTLNMILGDNEWVPIDRDYAELVSELTKGSTEFHIQMDRGPYDEDEFDSPRLWRYTFWSDTEQRRERARKWSEKQREERFIFDANIKQIMDVLKSEYDMPPELAHTSAYKIMKNKKTLKQKLKAFDITLYTTIKELP